MLRSTAWWLLFAIALAQPAHAQLSALVESESIEDASPPNRWYTVGGSASRSRRSLTAPVRGPVRTAWSHASGGTIESEPLVWDDVVFIETRQGESRVLTALRLLDGSVIDEEHFETTTPLSPSVWGDLIVLRSRPDQLSVYKLVPGNLSRHWRLDLDGPAGPPFIKGDAVFVVCESALSRYEVRHKEPTWTLDGVRNPNVAMAGDRLLACVADDGGGTGFPPTTTLAMVDPADGQIGERQFLCNYVDHALAPDIELVQWMSTSVQVRSAIALPNISPPTKSLLVPGTSWDRMQFAPETTPGYRGIAPVGNPDEGSLLLQADDEDRNPVLLRLTGDTTWILASRDDNADFATSTVPPTVVRDVAYVGPRAFELDSARVLWRRGFESVFAAVPARRSVLLVTEDTGESVLVALREGSASEGSQALRTMADEAKTTGLIALRDGSTLAGRFQHDAGTLKDLERRKRLDLSTVAVLTDEVGRVVHARSADDVFLGMDAIIAARKRDGYLQLAADAVASQDVALVSHLVDVARGLGASAEETKGLDSRIDRMKRRPKSVRSDKRQEIEAREHDLEDGALEILLAWMAANSEQDALGDLLLKSLLTLDPDHPVAVQRVRSRMPAGLDPPDPFDALDWLAFSEATVRTPVQVLTPLERIPSRLSDSTIIERVLHQSYMRWRKDVLGFKSERLLIVTPVDRPGALARCLSLGEIVCQALETTFTPALERREARLVEGRELVLHLYPERGAYLKSAGAGASHLENSAGHYDPSDNVSRIFIPEDEQGGFDSVMRTYAHELTHHWMANQSRLLQNMSRRQPGMGTPGFWIVEGVASLVASFRFDIAAGTWSPAPADFSALDIVANARDGQLIPWDEALAMSQATFMNPPYGSFSAIPRSTQLGVRQQLEPVSLLYAQAEVMARVLFEDPDLRPKLIEYYLDYATANLDGLDPARAFGISPKALGARAEAFARDAMRDQWEGR